MSDLIERLENSIELFRRYESCLPLVDRGLCNWRIRVALSEADEILSALKTVRGIEVAKRILIEWDDEDKIWRVNTYTSEGWQSGKTLSLAVDAAVGASEKG